MVVQGQKLSSCFFPARTYELLPCSILDIIIRDGIVYFAVIFSSNLLNTLIFFVSSSIYFPLGGDTQSAAPVQLAAPDLKATAAP